jgi:hypothetical protein
MNASKGDDKALRQVFELMRALDEFDKVSGSNRLELVLVESPRKSNPAEAPPKKDPEPTGEGRPYTVPFTIRGHHSKRGESEGGEGST